METLNTTGPESGQGTPDVDVPNIDTETPNTRGLHGTKKQTPKPLEIDTSAPQLAQSPSVIFAETPSPISPSPIAQMRYRVEYQDSTTGQIVHSIEATEPIKVATDSRELPFEEVKIFKVRSWRPGNSMGYFPPPPPPPPPLAPVFDVIPRSSSELSPSDQTNSADGASPRPSPRPYTPPPKEVASPPPPGSVSPPPPPVGITPLPESSPSKQTNSVKDGTSPPPSPPPHSPAPVGVAGPPPPATPPPASSLPRARPHRVRLKIKKRTPEIPNPGTVPPSRFLRIFSSAIINALQSVVRYYPSQDLTGDTVEVHWPYPILAHHYDELSKFADECEAKSPDQLCEREKNATTHIRALLKYLDTEIMDGVRAEQERNKRGFYTFEWFWVGHRPGTTILQRIVEDNNMERLVVQSVTGGILEYPTTSWQPVYWHMEFDGTYLGRTIRNIGPTRKFDGEARLDEDSFMIVGFGESVDTEGEHGELVKSLVEEGKSYWDLLNKQCRFHSGKSRIFPYNEIEGHVMVDMETYYEPPGMAKFKPLLLNSNDCRKWGSDCQCSVCKTKEKDAPVESSAFFLGYHDITTTYWATRSDHEYLLCPFSIPAFVFHTHSWEILHVTNFSPSRFDKTLIDNLVMDPSRLKMLKALAKSFARLNKSDEDIKEGPWSADFVKGKGNGLIFLLHGKPGVGKTCTAECIAEYTQRPLMVLTSSDIGTDSIAAELNLKREFKRAKSWGAVLLIDEADVFMQERSIRDLTRNSLVAGFLRALEFFDGILFLTTNRVGVFDDAFISRVHVKLYYPEFTEPQRAQIWQTFVDKLARERGKDMRLHPDAKYYLKGKEVRAMDWNGREIRNAFQTAVALAEYDAEKDEEGKIVVTDNHLRAVVELSKDFQDYLDKLHRGNESKRAERKGERLDKYDEGDGLDD